MWNGSGLEDSGSNPPTYSSGEGYGFKAKQTHGRGTNKSADDDAYDFDVEEGSDSDVDLEASDDYQPSAGYKPSAAAGRGGASSAGAGKKPLTAKTAKPSSDDEEDEGDNAWKSSWKDIMEGVGGSPTSTANESASPNLSEASPPPRGGAYGRGSLNSGKMRELDSSRDTDGGENSMDISASDFQVGVDAARRAKEKTNQRQRRQVMDIAPHKMQNPAGRPQMTASPDVKARNPNARGGSGNEGGSSAPNFKISAALSSIQRSDDSGEAFRYGGSVEKSDGDIYQMLGGAGSATASREGMGAGGKLSSAGRYDARYDISQDSTSRHVSDFSSDHDKQGRGDGDISGSDSGGGMGSDGSGDSDLAQSKERLTTNSRANASELNRLGGGDGSSQAAKSTNKAKASPDASDYDTDDFEDSAGEKGGTKDYAALRKEQEAARNMERIRQRWLNPTNSTELVSSLTSSKDIKAANVPAAAAAAAAPAPAAAEREPSDGDSDRSRGSRGSRNSDRSRSATRSPAPAAPDADDSDLQYADADPANAPKPAAEPELLQPGPRLLTAVGSASMVTSVPPPPPPQMSMSAEMIYTSAGGLDSSVDHKSHATHSVLDYSDSGRHSPASDKGTTAASSGNGNGGNRYMDLNDDSISPLQSKDAALAANTTAAPAAAAREPRTLETFPAPANKNIVVSISNTFDDGDDRDALKAGPVDGINAQGKANLLSKGQALQNTIVAIEIDPAVLGLKPEPAVKQERLSKPPLARTSGGLRNSQDSVGGGVASSASFTSKSSITKRPPNPPTHWPKELPMTSPSTQQLHAHLAMMESAESKRIAGIKAQAQKIREIRAASAKGPAHKVGGARSRSSGSSNKASAVAAVPASVGRLEQGTARLARQFEQMERELKTMRESGHAGAIEVQSGAKSVLGATPARGVGTGNHKGNSPSSIPTRAPPVPAELVNTYSSQEFGSKSRTSNASGSSGGGDQAARLGLSGALSARASGSLLQSGDRGAEGSLWDDEAMRTMQRIVSEGDKLQEKERALKVREEALRVREQVVEMDYRNPNKLGSRQLAGAAESGGDKAEAGAAREDGRVGILQAQVEELKARLFEATSKPAAEQDVNTSLPVPAQAKKNAHYTQQLAASQEAGTAEEGDITITRAKYNALNAEIASQEALIEGFQKENEKLVVQLKEAQTKSQSNKATYFDEREDLNRDLNRLRNKTGESIEEQMQGGAAGWGGGAGNMRRSADVLREELNKDSAIFALKERLGEAESRMGHREKELQKTIDRLRRDNQELAGEASSANKKTLHGHMDALKDKEKQVDALQEQNQGLRSKLEWYAENQTLIEVSEKDRKELRYQVTALQKELRRRGMEKTAVQTLLSAACNSPSSKHTTPEKAGAGDSDDENLADTTAVSGSARSSRRAHADVKKIKELEETVFDLQESLRKRNPDSVSNLVRAAAMSDEAVAERKLLDADVETARAELKDAREDFEMRLRSLRQEHEKVRTQYVNRIETLESAVSSTPAKPPLSRSSTPGSGDKGSPKTLAAAQARCKELEAEAERIRTFYTKKVEEEKLKGEAKIVALKRGASDGKTDDAMSYGNDATKAAAGAATGQDAPVPVDVAPEVAVADQIQNALAELRVEYEIKLGVYAAQLKTAQEAVSTFTSTAAPAPAATAADVRESPAFQAEVSREVAARLAAMPAPAAAIGASGGATAQQVSDLEHSVRMAEQKGQLEAEALRMRVREEEHKAQMLTSEVTSLRSQVAQVHQAPVQVQQGQQIALGTLQTLETQVAHLELRLARREQELMSAIEEGRSNSKIERARLEAIHRQELREKDEQLVKFQSELEQLVYALRQWQLIAHEAQQQAVVNMPPPPPVSFGLST